MTRILLFGLSANPPTGKGGHYGMMEYFSKSFDEIWILPVYRHTYSSKRNLASFQDRMEMCRLNFKDYDNVKVVDFEKTAFEAAGGEEALGTFDILVALQKEHCGVAFSLLLGGDTFVDFYNGKWKERDGIINMVENIVVLQRDGVEFPMGATNCKKAVFHTVPNLTNVSSTKARSADLKLLKTMVQPKVAEYIVEKSLYHAGTAT